MARPRFIRTADFPYHITARTVNREPFPLPITTTWEIFNDYLHGLSTRYECKIHSFVLMPNHFHLIVTPPLNNLSEAMHYFMRQSSGTIIRESGRINQLYGNRYHRTVIQTYHYFLHAYKYVYRNPVRAGLCAEVQMYPYSTLAGKLGLTRLTIPVTEDTLLFDENPEDTLRWLNSEPTLQNQEAVRNALRKHTFILPKQRNNNTPHELETYAL